MTTKIELPTEIKKIRNDFLKTLYEAGLLHTLIKESKEFEELCEQELVNIGQIVSALKESIRHITNHTNRFRLLYYFNVIKAWPGMVRVLAISLKLPTFFIAIMIGRASNYFEDSIFSVERGASIDKKKHLITTFVYSFLSACQLKPLNTTEFVKVSQGKISLSSIKLILFGAKHYTKEQYFISLQMVHWIASTTNPIGFWASPFANRMNFVTKSKRKFCRDHFKFTNEGVFLKDEITQTELNVAANTDYGGIVYSPNESENNSLKSFFSTEMINNQHCKLKGSFFNIEIDEPRKEIIISVFGKEIRFTEHAIYNQKSLSL